MTKRSSEYVMTVRTDDPKLPEIIASIKKSIKVYNAERRVYELSNPEFVTYSWSGKQEVRKRATLRVRGRLGKNNPNAHLYRRGGPFYRWSSQDYKLEHSERVDIYVNERRLYVPVKED
jgi:hypothetical protein